METSPVCWGRGAGRYRRSLGHKQKIPLVGMETLTFFPLSRESSCVSQTENPARRDGNDIIDDGVADPVALLRSQTENPARRDGNGIVSLSFL
jgi:hypothetical protein